MNEISKSEITDSGTPAHTGPCCDHSAPAAKKTENNVFKINKEKGH
jgi:hypothetical protein